MTARAVPADPALVWSAEQDNPLSLALLLKNTTNPVALGFKIYFLGQPKGLWLGQFTEFTGRFQDLFPSA